MTREKNQKKIMITTIIIIIRKKVKKLSKKKNFVKEIRDWAPQKYEKTRVRRKKVLSFTILFFIHIFILCVDKSKYLIWNAGTRFSDYFVMKLLMEVNAVIFRSGFSSDYLLLLVHQIKVPIVKKKKEGKQSYTREVDFENRKIS